MVKKLTIKFKIMDIKIHKIYILRQVFYNINKFILISIIEIVNLNEYLIIFSASLNYKYEQYVGNRKN